MIAGGRNDEECKNMSTPFLEDIHLFLLDQKAWIPVKYTPFSQRLLRLGNHTSCTMTNSFSYEKTILFGGITYSTVGGDDDHDSTHKKDNQPKKQPKTHLSNDMYVIEVRQI